MLCPNGSLGFQCCNTREGQGLHVLENFPSVHVELQQEVKCNVIVGGGAPTEPSLMTYCFWVFFIPSWAKLSGMGKWVPYKTVFSGPGKMGQDSIRQELVAGQSPWSHKLPGQCNGARSSVSENLETRDARHYFALKLFHLGFLASAAPFGEVQIHLSILPKSPPPSHLCSRYPKEQKAWWASCILIISTAAISQGYQGPFQASGGLTRKTILLEL